MPGAERAPKTSASPSMWKLSEAFYSGGTSEGPKRTRISKVTQKMVGAPSKAPRHCCLFVLVDELQASLHFLGNEAAVLLEAGQRPGQVMNTGDRIGPRLPHMLGFIRVVPDTYQCVRERAAAKTAHGHALAVEGVQDVEGGLAEQNLEWCVQERVTSHFQAVGAVEREALDVFGASSQTQV